MIPKILFVLGRYPNPRMNKRINNAKENNEVSLICWDKGTLTNLNIIFDDIRIDTVKIHADGTSPAKRILPTIFFGYRLCRLIKNIDPDIIHVENLDMLSGIMMFHSLKRNVKIIYEIADLHPILINQSKSIKERVIKGILYRKEKKYMKRVSLMIITSPQFYSAYYNRMIDLKKVLFIPNVPDPKYFAAYRKKSGGEFTVGYIGGIRYKKQMEMLIQVVGEAKVNLFFAGFSFDDEIKELCKKYDNIEYYGRYDFETEIAALYGKIDCIYSVYDADDNNVKSALPNKLYEAVLCCIPIIVAKGTYLEETVKEWGVGVAVSHTNPKELTDVLKKLKDDKTFYNSLVSACHLRRDQMDLEPYNKKLNSIVAQWYI